MNNTFESECELLVVSVQDSLIYSASELSWL